MRQVKNYLIYFSRSVFEIDLVAKILGKYHESLLLTITTAYINPFEPKTFFPLCFVAGLRSFFQHFFAAEGSNGLTNPVPMQLLNTLQGAEKVLIVK